MRNFSSTIVRNAWIFTAIFDHNMTDVDVANNIAMHRDVLANHKPVENTQTHTQREIDRETNTNYLLFGHTPHSVCLRWKRVHRTLSRITWALANARPCQTNLNLLRHVSVCLWSNTGAADRLNEVIACSASEQTKQIKGKKKKQKWEITTYAILLY